MRVLVIGASGLVGKACYELFQANKGNIVIGTYRSFFINDYLYFNPLQESFSLKILNGKWDLIIHTAALTNVDLCEAEIENSYNNTVLITKLIVENIKNSSAHLSYISTDYVFDGKKGPYYENDKVNPINVYGMHKLEAEEIIQSSLNNYSILRVTGVYGEEERNKNFVARLVDQLKCNSLEKIKVPIDQFATPVYVGDIARCIDYIFSNKERGIFHASGNDYYNRYQLVQKIVSYFPDNNVYIEGIETKLFNQVAMRPLKGGLVNSKLYTISPKFIFTNIDSYLKKIIYGI